MTDVSIYIVLGKVQLSLSEGVTDKIKRHYTGLQTQVPA